MRIWVPAPAGTSLGHKKILVRRNWQLRNMEVWRMGMRILVPDPAGTSLGHMKILVRRNWQLGNLEVW